MPGEKLCKRPGSYPGLSAGAWTVLVALLLAAAGCSREPPPHTVVEFVENPRLLEATMLRCAENRIELKYTQNCLNAREAVDRIAAEEEAARRAELEAQSARKRDELRRAREAAEEARARAEEAARQREEAEYLSQFDETAEPQPAAGEGSDVEAGEAAADQAGDAAADTGNAGYSDAAADEPPPAVSSDEPPAATGEQSLQDVREELGRRRQADDPEPSSADNQ